MWRLFRWLLLLGLVCGIGYAAAVPGMAWWRERTKVRFTTTKTSRGRIESVVNSTGTVKPVRTVLIGAFVSGPLKEVKVDFNDRVEKGQLLAQIDPSLLSAAVRRDEATLRTQQAERDRVKALLKQATRNEGRGKRLIAVNKDYLSETEMDQLRFTRESQEAQLELAEASIRQAAANLENSRANLNYTRITSPVAGIVIDRKVDPGQTVAASFQTPELFTVAPEMEKHMHVYASVDEADIGQIEVAKKLDKPVRFTVDAYPSDLFNGKIYQVRKSSTTTQNVVTYPVIIEAANPDLKLMPGMTANISFQIEVRDKVLRIPSAAMRFVPLLSQIRPEDKSYLDGTTAAQPESGTRLSASQKVEMAKGRSRRIVWIQDGEKLRAVPVVLGLADSQFAELLEGEITEGQDLVTGIENPFGGGAK